MANTKSAIKRIGTSEKRHQRNVAVKSAARTFVRKARESIAGTPTESQADVVAAIAALDRAARKGVIHRNNAARRKSRLMKRFNVAQATIAAAPETPAAEEAPATKSRRKAATSRGKTAASSAQATAVEGAEDAAAKPKRTTRTRKMTEEPSA